MADTVREIDRASAAMRELSTYAAAGPGRDRTPPRKEGETAVNPVRKFVGFMRELDRGLAMMRGEAPGVDPNRVKGP